MITMKIKRKQMAAFAAIFLIMMLAQAASPYQIILNTANPVKNDTVTITLKEGVNPLPKAVVHFSLNNGNPILAITDDQGQARFVPLNSGNLNISATTKDGILLTSTTINVAEPSGTPTPSVSATPAHYSSGEATTSETGGGVSGGENASNIEMKDTRDIQIFNDKMTTVRFTDKRNPLVTANITGNTDAGVVTIQVELLKNTSLLAASPAPGLVNTNFNIWIGKNGKDIQTNIKETDLIFKVNNSWLAGNDINSSEIRLERWDENEWTELDTSENSKDDTYTYFSVSTNRFGTFAITGIKAAAPGGPAGGGVIEETTPAVTETPETSATTPKGTPGFEILISVIALMVLYLRRMVQ